MPTSAVAGVDRDPGRWRTTTHAQSLRQSLERRNIGGVTVPLLDAHQRADAIQQAKNNASQASATLDKVRIEAMRQVVAAQNTLRTSIAANRASATLVDAAQTAYEAARDVYMHDVGTVTEVLASQTQLEQAKLSLDESESTALTAAVTLAFASGRLGSPPQ